MELNHSHGISLMGENHVKPPFFTSGLFIYYYLLFNVGLDTVFTALCFQCCVFLFFFFFLARN